MLHLIWKQLFCITFLSICNYFQHFITLFSGINSFSIFNGVTLLNSLNTSIFWLILWEVPFWLATDSKQNRTECFILDLSIQAHRLSPFKTYLSYWMPKFDLSAQLRCRSNLVSTKFDQSLSSTHLINCLFMQTLIRLGECPNTLAQMFCRATLATQND